MSELQTQINEVVAGLQKLSQQLTSVDDLAAKESASKANLKATTEQLETAKAELGKASSGLSAAQAKNLQKHDEDIYRMSQQLSNLNTQITAAREQLEVVKAESNSARLYHDQILDSIESLRKKIA